jgi:MiaB/RimO family radical SAM methylthiotransferase
MAKVQIIETSCNRRELEVEQVKNYFYANGYEISKKDFDTDIHADIIILSTCGFTQAAEDFALKTLKRIEKEMRPGTKIYIGGCLPKINKEILAGYQTFDPRNYELLDEYFDMEKKFSQFKRPNIISNFQVHPKYREHGIMSVKNTNLDKIGKQTSKENLSNVEEITKIVLEKSNSVFRIQCMLGCAYKCTYCAIKFAIGPIKSRSSKEILSEIRQGIEKGYSSILLEGDSLESYGLDIETDIGKLLDEVINLIKDIPIRISIPDVSPLYLDRCTTQIIKLAEMEKIFNFYTPIQSGSQKILNMMKRGYEIDKAKNIIKAIKSACPNLKCGTSLIVGFPGENEEDFNKTIDICKELKFNYIYCHSYSDRKGTEAEKLQNKIPGNIILKRARTLKTELRSITQLITIAEDTAGNITCQG